VAASTENLRSAVSGRRPRVIMTDQAVGLPTWGMDNDAARALTERSSGGWRRHESNFRGLRVGNQT